MAMVVAKDRELGRYLSLPNPKNEGKIAFHFKREEATKFKNAPEAAKLIAGWPELTYYKWEYETV